MERSIQFTLIAFCITIQIHQIVCISSYTCKRGECLPRSDCNWYDSIILKNTGNCIDTEPQNVCCLRKSKIRSIYVDVDDTDHSVSSDTDHTVSLDTYMTVSSDTDTTEDSTKFDEAATPTEAISNIQFERGKWRPVRKYNPQWMTNDYSNYYNNPRSGDDAHGKNYKAMCGFRTDFGRRRYRYRRNGERTDAEYVNFDERESPNSVETFAKVVGGRESEPFSWPWMAALFKQNAPWTHRFICAGTLISPRFILTAAHVFTSKDIRDATSFFVRLGTHTGHENYGEYRVARIHVHPQYRPQYYYNDIALLELDRNVDYGRFVYPVCLPFNGMYCEDGDLVGRNVTVTGWGDDAFGGKSSGVLQEATFPVVSRDECNAAYVRVASSRFPRGLSKRMMCAGEFEGGKDACQGDSGGPLTLRVGRRWVQVGIVSLATDVVILNTRVSTQRLLTT